MSKVCDANVASLSHYISMMYTKADGFKNQSSSLDPILTPKKGPFERAIWQPQLLRPIL